MALIKNSMNGLAACKKLGVSDELLSWLQAHGGVKLTASEFQFAAVGAAGSPVVPVTVDTLQKLAAGQLAGYELHTLLQAVRVAIKALKFEVEGQIEQPVTIASVEQAEQLSAALAETKAKTTLGKLPAQKPAGQAAQAEPFPPFPVDQMKTAEPVQLRIATQMYQPVKGSSAGSRYFVVAANQELRIAAKWESGALAIRIEGPKWEKAKAKITDCGFTTIDPKKGYASLHLSVGNDPILAGKTLGAVLMGLGLELQTPFPILKLIAN